MNTNTHILLEGPRIDPGMAVKLDTSLEHDLSKYSNDRSNSSYCSTSSDVHNSDKEGCQHHKLVTQGDYDNCFHCGAYVSKTGSKTFKGKNMNYSTFFPPKSIYESMIRRSIQISQSANPEYSELRKTYIEWLFGLAEKLGVSQKSVHLAAILLDVVMYKDPSLTQRIQLFTPICLLVASKAIELDERIPFIPRLRRYANSTFSISDYTDAELLVLDLVDWNPQFTSVLELMEFLMCQGVLFSSDEIEEERNGQRLGGEGLRENTQHGNTNYLETKNRDIGEAITKLERSISAGPRENYENLCHEGFINEKKSKYSGNVDKEICTSSIRRKLTEKKVPEILTYFETNYIKLATLLIKDIEFIGWEPKVISAAIIAFFRNMYKITPIWNVELEAITQLKFQQISACYELMNYNYHSTFSLYLPNLQNDLYSQENQLDIVLTKSNSVYSDRFSGAHPEFELPNMGNAPRTGGLVETDLNVLDHRAFEKKLTLNSQSKSDIPVSIAPVPNTFLRMNSTSSLINSQNYPAKNTLLPPCYQVPRYEPSQEYPSYYSDISTTNSYSSLGQASYPSYTYLHGTSYPSKSGAVSSFGNQNIGSFENKFSYN